MTEKKSLPLSFLINANAEESELLRPEKLNSLLVIGKSDNGRGTDYGIYKTADEVKAHYGVEAPEYRIASHYFSQNEDGELTIASAEYSSVTRTKTVQPPVEPEPEVEDDTDFKREYMAVGYEPIEREYASPEEPEPTPELEPEPEPITCLSTKVEFNSIDKTGIDLNSHVGLWSVIEIEGVDYAIASEYSTARELLKEINNKGVGYVSNRLIASTLKELLRRYPNKASALYNHTNFAISEYDYGKELSGIDEINKPVLIEQITSAGGTADGFDKSETVIKFKPLSPEDLAGRKRGEYLPLDLMELFNKGKQAILSSCLMFNYKKPPIAIDTVCRATAVDIYKFAEHYTNYSEANIKVLLRIDIDGSERTVSTKIGSASLHNLIAEKGISHTANELLANLVLTAIDEDKSIAGAFYEQTNFGIASFDYSRELSGIDSDNMQAYSDAVSELNGRVSNFRNKASVIKLKPVAGYRVSDYDEPDAKTVNFTDLFETDEIIVSGCLAFDYTPIERKEPIYVSPPEEPEPEEPAPVDSEALIIDIKPLVTGVSEDDESAKQGLVVMVEMYDDTDGLVEYSGEFTLKVNGELAADHNGIYNDRFAYDNVELGTISININQFSVYDQETDSYIASDTIVELVSDAYSTQMYIQNDDYIDGGHIADINIANLPSRPLNKHVKFNGLKNDDGVFITNNLPANITDLTGTFSYGGYDRPINWDVSHVEYFTNTFKGSSINSPIFDGSSFESAISTAGMLSSTPNFNQPLNWTNFSPQAAKDMLSGAESFNQSIDIFDSSKMSLDAFVSLFNWSMPSFNQDLSHWSTASTPDVYYYDTEEYMKVMSIGKVNPNWTAPKMVFGVLKMKFGDGSEELMTEQFTPDFK